MIESEPAVTQDKFQVVSSSQNIFNQQTGFKIRNVLCIHPKQHSTVEFTINKSERGDDAQFTVSVCAVCLCNPLPAKRMKTHND